MTVSLAPIQPAAIGEVWPVLGPLLAPAVRYDMNRSLADVRDLLLSGQCEAAIVASDDVRGVIVTEICQLDGHKVCWISYVAGQVDASPRVWLKIMRDGIRQLEDLARGAGCAETRIGGRDWSRILPGYERFDDEPNRLRKVLLNG
jgi:hypothetical protein